MSDDYLVMPAQSGERKLRIDNFFKGLSLNRDESVSDADAAGLSYNFDFSSGALADGRGVEKYGVNLGFKPSYFWRFNRGAGQILMFADSNGVVYYLSGQGGAQSGQGGVVPLEGVRITGRIYAVNYRLYGEDVILICSDSDDMLVWNGEDTPYSVTGSPKVVSMAAHGARLLVIDSEKNALRYSMDLDPTNWNENALEGGYIQLNGCKGKLNKVISFLNYAYVFRDYCISRISFSSNAPVVADLFTSGGKIYADTAAIVGDKVIFLCSDGLYEFDGLDTKRILPNLKGAFLPSALSCAAYHNGEYYLALRLNPGSFDNEVVGCEEGAYVNNGLLVYDRESGGYCICRGMDITGFAEYADNLLVLCQGQIGAAVRQSTYFGKPLKKKWRSVFTDLGSEKLKTLRRVHIDCSSGVTLTVNADGTERSFDIGGDKVRINMRGKKLSFSFCSSSVNAKITRPVLILSQ